MLWAGLACVGFCNPGLAWAWIRNDRGPMAMSAIVDFGSPPLATGFGRIGRLVGSMGLRGVSGRTPQRAFRALFLSTGVCA